MIHIRSIVFLLLSCMIVFALQTPLRADETEEPTKLTLHPQIESQPAMRYRLLPGFMDQTPGNAAVNYGKVTAEEWGFFTNRELRDNYHAWLDMPLEDLRRDKPHLPTSGNIEAQLRRAARCSLCDWQLPIREEPPFYMLLLPEVQQMREFGRVLACRARLQIAEGQFDEAVFTFQSGYAAARNVAEGETFVNGLVGNAICGQLNQQLTEFIQQPEAPSLYWALSMLPRPFIDIRDAVDVEANGLSLSFPELRDLETAQRSPEEWRDSFHKFATTVLELIRSSEDPPPPTAEEIDQRCEQELPVARLALIEGGLSAEQVQQMSLHQVAMLYTVRIHRELLEDGLKYYYIPYPQAITRIDAAIASAKQESVEIIPLAQLTLPAIRAAHTAIVRGERQFAVLRVCEALRLHAASHDGGLPNSLSEVVEVPIPDDPVSGESFEYRVENGKAILTGPPLPGHPLHYEISMASR